MNPPVINTKIRLIVIPHIDNWIPHPRNGSTSRITVALNLCHKLMLNIMQHAFRRQRAFLDPIRLPRERLHAVIVPVHGPAKGLLPIFHLSSKNIYDRPLGCGRSRYPYYAGDSTERQEDETANFG